MREREKTMSGGGWTRRAGCYCRRCLPDPGGQRSLACRRCERGECRCVNDHSLSCDGVPPSDWRTQIESSHGRWWSGHRDFEYWTLWGGWSVRPWAAC